MEMTRRQFALAIRAAELCAVLILRSPFPNRSSPRRRSRPSHLGARSGGLGWHKFLVGRCPQ
jgi:hypothetical protein